MSCMNRIYMASQCSGGEHPRRSRAEAELRSQIPQPREEAVLFRRPWTRRGEFSGRFPAS
ncbi:hypothetical protein PHJA_002251800 [Phtheirospermum japonicum]|uniref:Uncharacterized protein n=1 Tax=Phtheirospermum japonicum TaxID=374723 RepID=A0A830CTV7_9LAMI|nr:hypothetical protein PHJA_002251800 [Phtheirospermum japonicum]